MLESGDDVRYETDRSGWVEGVKRFFHKDMCHNVDEQSIWIWKAERDTALFYDKIGEIVGASFIHLLKGLFIRND
jgi:hypothetical protein